MPGQDGRPPLIAALLSPKHESSHQFFEEPASYEAERPGSSSRRDHVNSRTTLQDELGSEDSSCESEDEYGPTSQHIHKARENRQKALSSTGTQAVDSPLLDREALTAVPTWRHRLSSIQQWLSLNSVQKKVLKCSVAYSIASLFTLNPLLSSLLGQPFDYEGPTANAHFIATVAVYYNPAKTVGAMLEADLFMLWAATFAITICCASMFTAVWLNREDFEWLSHLVVLAFFFTGSCGFIAFMKQRVGKATFGSACSMAALIISVVLTKEGAVHLGYFEGGIILQLLMIVFLGTLISNLVCFLLFRGSATSLLQGNLNKTLDSFSVLLVMLTKAFLLEDDLTTTETRLQKATAAHEASFTSLKSAFEEAKLELFDPRIQRCVGVYQAAVASMTRLAKHLNGLREGCRSQLSLISQQQAHATAVKRNEDFAVFEEHVGPSLRLLIAACRSTLKEMRTTFLRSVAGQSSAEQSATESLDALHHLHDTLKRRHADFISAHSGILKRLQQEHASTIDTSGILQSDRRFIDTRQAGDFVFTVYFFLFNIDAFVKELDNLLSLFGKLRAEERRLQDKRVRLVQTYGGLLGEAFYRLHIGEAAAENSGHTSLQRWPLLKERLLTLLPSSTSASLFPDVRAAADTYREPDLSRMSRPQRIAYKIWRTCKNFDDDVFKYALKTGVGAGILAIPAFLPQTRGLWRIYRGEWSLISFVVAATSVGQSNFNAFFRIVGTLFGALVALAAYQLTEHQPVLLFTIGFIFSLPNFWLIVTKPRWATTGRFVLLTYNLTALYAYNKREQNVPIVTIALRRSTAVIAGSLWAWFISVSVWPYQARRELRAELSTLLMNCAYYYQRLIAFYSIPQAPPASATVDSAPTERSSLLGQKGSVGVSSADSKDMMAMELYLQRTAIKLNGLLYQATLEPRLRGPFPVSIYREILENVQGILDQLHLMQAVTSRDEWAHVHRDFLMPFPGLRKELVGNVLLYFNILASSISLKTPLPTYLPPAGLARERLVHAIRQLDLVKKRQVRHSNTYLLYFAYAIALKDLIDHLEAIHSLIEDLL